jgi:hypothetical protein
MNKYRHVNFGNDSTYHVYTWFIESEQADIALMIQQAFDFAADVEDAIELQPLETVEKKLGESLDAWFELNCWPSLGAESYPHEYCPGDFPGPDNVNESLLGALAGFAAQDIRWYAIAEALLRDAGKWNPDHDLPRPEVKP